MSGKRRRSETSWDMKQDKMPSAEISSWQEKDLNSRVRPPKSSSSESIDPGRSSWEGNRNRNVPKGDDISRHKRRMQTDPAFDGQSEKQYTTRPSDDSYNLPYRGRDRSRSPNRSRRGRDRESTRARSRSPFYNRHKSHEYGDARNNSRLSSRSSKESWGSRPKYAGGSRDNDNGNSRNLYDDDQDDKHQSSRISKIQCKFFAAGNCSRDNCKFSHDVPDSRHHDRRSHDPIRIDKNRTWHDRQPHADLNASDLSENKKSWGGPSWDDGESGGFDKRSHNNIQGHASDYKKTSWDGPSWDDVSNPNLDNKNRSWNGPSWDGVSASGISNKPCHNSENTKSGNATSRGTISANSSNTLDEKTKSWNGPLWDEVNVKDGTSLMDNKMRKWDHPGLNEKGWEKKDDFLPKQHNVVNDSHLNNDKIVSEEPNQQVLTSGGQVENGKSLKGIAGNAEQEQEIINTEKVEEGTILNDEKCMGQQRDGDQSRSPNRSRSRGWESRSPFNDDRHKSNEYGSSVKNKDFRSGDCRKGIYSQGLKESWDHRPDYSRSSHNRNSRNHYDDDEDGSHQSNRISKIQCRFFAAGNCSRDNCKFSHDIPDSSNYNRRSHDNTRAHKNMTWHDGQTHTDLNASYLSEKNKSWNGPSWDDVEPGGFVERSNNNIVSRTSDDKKKSWNGPSWDDVEPGGFVERSHNNIVSRTSDDKKKSWVGPSWDDVKSGGFDENKKRTWDSHHSDDKKKSPQDDVFNPNLDKKNRSWSGPSWDQVDASGGTNSAKSSNNIDEKSKSWNGPSWDQVDALGGTNGAKSSNNIDEETKSRNGPSWDQVDASGGANGAKLTNNIDEKTNSWNGPSWDDEKGCEKNDYFLPQQHNVVHDSHLNNDNILSVEPNQQIFTSGKGQVPPVYTEQNLANAIDYLKSLPTSIHNQNTRPKEANIGTDVMDIENGKSPKKKQEPVGNRKGNESKVAGNTKQEQENINHEKVKEGNSENGKSPKKKQEPVGNREGNESKVAGNTKQEQENINHEKVKEGNSGNDEKSMRQFRVALVEFVKEILKPKWKEGRMTREVYKTVVKKVVDKVTSTIQKIQIPTTQAKIELYLANSKPKIMKLVEAYVEKLVKA